MKTHNGDNVGVFSCSDFVLIFQTTSIVFAPPLLLVFIQLSYLLSLQLANV